MRVPGFDSECPPLLHFLSLRSKVVSVGEGKVVKRFGQSQFNKRHLLDDDEFNSIAFFILKNALIRPSTNIVGETSI